MLIFENRIHFVATVFLTILVEGFVYLAVSCSIFRWCNSILDLRSSTQRSSIQPLYTCPAAHLPLRTSCGSLQHSCVSQCIPQSLCHPRRFETLSQSAVEKPTLRQ